MRILVLFAHPVSESFGGELHRTVVSTLTAAGHDVDDCDLYAEGFDPVMSRDERLGYHTLASNEVPVQPYVDRLRQAEAVIFCFPTWLYGPPAIMKGFFDRVFMPGVAFGLKDDGSIEGLLPGIRKIAAVVTYGGNRWRTLLAGDPPRKVICRAIPAYTNYKAHVRYLARYNMNTMTEAHGRQFIERVRREMMRF